MSKLTTTISFQMGCMFAIAMLSYTNGKVDKIPKITLGYSFQNIENII